MVMHLLDRWDEAKASHGERAKLPMPFRVDPHLVFSDMHRESTLQQLLERMKSINYEDFFQPDNATPSIAELDDFITFDSELSTDIPLNNKVWVRLNSVGSTKKVVILIHHWNATHRSQGMVKLFQRMGYSTAEFTMPYHFQRARPNSLYADYMLSPSVGRTLQSMRQSVLDAQQLVGILKQMGFEEFGVMGASLGSWVAGTLAAFNKEITKASLLLPGGSLAEMIWTGRATRSIKAVLSDNITLDQLRQAWVPFDLSHQARSLARPELEIQIIFAKRDKVVVPALTSQLIGTISETKTIRSIVPVNCGHYSLARAPFSLWTAFHLSRFF